MQKFCESCGMPLEKKEDFAGGDEKAKFCLYCVNPDGSVKSCEEIFAGGVQFFLNQIGGDRKMAEKITRKNMSQQPYWQGKDCAILAALELTKRVLAVADTGLPVINSAKEAAAQLAELHSAKREHFVALYLNARNQLVSKETVSVGTLNASLVHPREIFEPAVRNLAAQIIVAHNHPSGELEPSSEDLAITRRLVEAGKLLGIEVIDHLILTADNWLSLKDKKWL